MSLHFIPFNCTNSQIIAGLPQLSVFTRYINNTAVSEDLLFF